MFNVPPRAPCLADVAEAPPAATSASSAIHRTTAPARPLRTGSVIFKAFTPFETWGHRFRDRWFVSRCDARAAARLPQIDNALARIDRLDQAAARGSPGRARLRSAASIRDCSSDVSSRARIQLNA